MIVLGLLLGIVGTDVNSGVQRFTFGMPELSDGIGFVVVAMGLFGFAEIIINLEQGEKREVFTDKVDGPADQVERLQGARWPAILRGTALGSFLGILPGGGALLSSFASYTRREEARQGPVAVRQGRDRGRGRRRKPPTTPARRPRSSRC